MKELDQLVVFASLRVKVAVETWVIQQSQHFLVFFHTWILFTLHAQTCRGVERLFHWLLTGRDNGWAQHVQPVSRVRWRRWIHFFLIVTALVHRGWETRVPRGRVITAGTDADITVVYLRRAQAMGSPSVLQVFILLPPEARQHLQLRFAHLAGLIVSPVIFLTQKDREIRVYCSFNFMSYQ